MKILITDGLSPNILDLLKARGFEAELQPTPPAESLPAILGDFEAVAIRSATRITADALANSGKLRLIVRGGVGVDNIDIAAATAKGIAVANTPGANAIATAELTFSLMLALARRIAQAHQSLASHAWERSSFKGSELHGKTLFLVGFGRIGRELARRASAFGMQVLAYDPYLDDAVFAKHHATRVVLRDGLQKAEYVSLHMPLTEATRHIIDAETIAQMKKGARLLNCARGGLVDESAVAAALDAGHLAGAAFDVYEQEPPATENRLIGRRDVVHVPHLGASTTEAQSRVAIEVAQVIEDYLLHKTGDSILNKAQLQ